VTAVHYAILTYNRKQSLAALLESIVAQAYGCAYAITILDNGSTAEHAGAVHSLASRYGAALVRSEVNLRMAGRRLLEDRIFEVGTDADVLVHLDDDVVLGEDWLGAVLDVLATGSFAACGSIEDRDGDLMISGQRTIEIDSYATPRGPADVWRWRWHSPEPGEPAIPVEFAGHRALAVRIETARDVRHDPDLIAGGDDVAYSLALRRSARRLAVARQAVIVHRSLGERGASGFRSPDAVIESWRCFHQEWGFVRDTAAHEVGLTLDGFLEAVRGTEADAPKAPRRTIGEPR
jgi:GT2 family glycosyltransferase